GSRPDGPATENDGLHDAILRADVLQLSQRTESVHSDQQPDGHGRAVLDQEAAQAKRSRRRIRSQAEKATQRHPAQAFLVRAAAAAGRGSAKAAVRAGAAQEETTQILKAALEPAAAYPHLLL